MGALLRVFEALLEPRTVVDFCPEGDTVVVRVRAVPELLTVDLTVVWLEEDVLDDEDLEPEVWPDDDGDTDEVPEFEDEERDVVADREGEAVAAVGAVLEEEDAEADLVTVLDSWMSLMSFAFTTFSGVLALRTVKERSGYFAP